MMISNVDSQRFVQLFKGKSNTYVRNELPKEKPEAGHKIKTKITNNEGKVDKDLLTHHLNGDFGVGVCPVNAEGKCFFGVIDIDYYKSKIRRVLSFIKDYQLPLLPFRSKSGGLHVYLMLSKAVSAKTMRETLNQIVYYFSLDMLYGKAKVEIFPKQEKAEGFGSSVTLPYFNAEKPYTYLLDLDGNPVPFKEALDYIQKHFTTVEDVKQALEHLPYNDAPPCIQRALISEEVGGEDTGRNNFLFSYAVYAKKKWGGGFEDYVVEANERFAVPLEDNVVEQICASVRDHEYVYKCKDIPCNSFCDKPTCRKREFGLGKDKGHFTGIDYGQLFRYKTAEPYYIWKLRLVGQEAWVDVIFKDEGYLLDQRNFAKMCVRYLNQAPMQVSNNDWYAILNSVLPNVQDVEVKQESDTSALSMLHNAFIDYLSNKQARRDMPYQIKMGLCIRQVVNGVAKYYFTHRGFAEYLKNQKVSFDYSMLREMLKQFGAVEDVLAYTNSFGEDVHFPCWSKADDSVIEEAYKGAMEVEQGDKNSLALSGVGEASNVEEYEAKEEEKLYSEKDKEDSEGLF
jgi:hypothetical protein